MLLTLFLKERFVCLPRFRVYQITVWFLRQPLAYLDPRPGGRGTLYQVKPIGFSECFQLLSYAHRAQQSASLKAFYFFGRYLFPYFIGQQQVNIVFSTAPMTGASVAFFFHLVFLSRQTAPDGLTVKKELFPNLKSEPRPQRCFAENLKRHVVNFPSHCFFLSKISRPILAFPFFLKVKWI